MEQQQYTINGVKVAFPCKAYPTQLSMMSMIIKGIEKRQNCLLESPTGSGKSLALLCSCLGWLKGEKDKRDRAEQENYQDIEGFPSPGSGDDLKKPCNCNCNNQTTKPATSPETVTTSSASNGPSTSMASLPSAPEILQPPVAVVPQPENQDKVIPEGDVGKTDQDGSREDAKDEESKDGDDDDDDDDDDFQPSKKRARPSSNHVTAGKKAKRQKGVVYEDEVDSSPGASRHPHTQAHWQMKLMTPQANAAATELSSRESTKEKSPCYCSCHLSKSNKLDKENKMKDNDAPPKKIPRIYFGTRTHKQIAQIIREMGRTSYKETRMTILASREHTCVHPEVSRSRNKNEGCKDLLDNNKGGSCKYYQNVHKMKQQWQIRDYGLTQAWDIEDLVDLGRRVKSCPYFASRNLREGADVVFCPYNYLIDPVIRESMEINLKGQIVVLDEAHNIEDSAREAASLKVTTEQLQETTDELDRLLTAQYRMEHTRVLHTVCSSILRWINDFSGTLRQNDFERASRVWSGQEMVAVLANMGITPATLSTLRHHLNGLTEEEDPDKKYKELGPKFTTTSASLINGLFIVFNFLFKEDYKYMMDYQVALLKTKAHNQHPDTNNRWLNRRRGRESTWTISLNFWCLNPAVAFSDFGSSVRTIILTSGTLSPMSSFASELGVKFPIQLEANHVIGKSQVWVSSLAIGPNGHSLNASYRNAETFAFQDDLGRVVTEVCKVTPYGVLCFLPSYSMMNKLMERWKATGAYYQLESMKSVMCEARGGDKTVFDEQLKEFYDIIKECEENGLENQTITGVLMFAVCRGKISEGMDFADNNARAVITVGIPFPNVRDSQVELKRKYNDQHSASRGLLTGSEWYEVQAYRALNQALGRCIRHKKDWGAILLVDDRFSRNPKKYISGLSKWVRGRVIHHTHARDALSSLSEFANSRMQGSSPPAE
ncbi:Fanconi anemia group J protein homolog [Diadema setosum]|uniref:Fanconi anemia group J protein homolog n=1 Tax=Diadema setosum TaxID=31175 RepID=UPI003B3ABC51